MKDLTNISNSLIVKIIDEWVQGERNRDVLKDRYINGVCYEPLAEKYDVSVSTVKRTVNKYSPVIFKQLEKESQEDKSGNVVMTMPFVAN